ncbi:MAG: DUF7901 domain-containing protein, partial [Planctomycetota bacterium]
TFTFDASDAFQQTEGEVYWLGVNHSFDLNGDGLVNLMDTTLLVEYRWWAYGWKTSADHWNDNAVFVDVNTFGTSGEIAPETGRWKELYDPRTPLPRPIDLSFELVTPAGPVQEVKWSQPPEPYVPEDAYYGWDDPSVYGSGRIVADDWLCTTDDPVTDVHWWGSYVGWSLPEPPELPDQFHLGIWTDVPADPGDPVQWFSHPGELIWESWAIDYRWKFVGWDFDPRDPLAAPEATFYFEYDLPEDEWFYQELGDNIYWISIAADYLDTDLPAYPFGWKTRPRDPNSPAPDDAVRIFDPVAPSLTDAPPISDTTLFPTPGGRYDSLNGATFYGLTEGMYATEIVSMSLQGLNGASITPPVVCCTEYHVESFFDVFVELSVDGGASWIASFYNAKINLGIINPGGGTTGAFDTEMVSLSLSGGDFGTGTVLRTSPTMPSPGGHMITDLGGGLYHIDSFFDVFTELSVDGGNSWTAADGPIRVLMNMPVNTYVDGEPIWWPTPAESWDMAFVLTTQEVARDWGDAPDGHGVTGYPTLSANFGANHIIRGPWLGDASDAPDSEPDGQPDPLALGDDMDTDPANPAPNYDDENGVAIPVLTPGVAAPVTVTVNGGGGVVEAWIDFNGDMIWDLSEQVFAGYLADGTHTIWVTAPIGSPAGQTFGRFRISTNGGLTPAGPASDGEVEDYEVTIAEPDKDWGDAPDSRYVPGYPTLAIHNGANHVIGGPWLGDANDAPDAEFNGQPDPAAAGDNNNGIDDENGVSIPVLVQATTGVIVVEVNGGGGVLQAWIDWNQDETWDAGELIFAGLVGDGFHNINVTPPAVAVPGQTFARFRISTLGGLSPEGSARDGEVEDHPVEIEELPIDWGDAPDRIPAAAGYPTLAAHNGASHIIGGPWLGPDDD